MDVKFGNNSNFFRVDSTKCFTIIDLMMFTPLAATWEREENKV